MLKQLRQSVKRVVIVFSAIVVSGATVFVLPPASPDVSAAAPTESIGIGMPFEGKWGYNGNVSIANSSHPSVHEPYTGWDWAVDIYNKEADANVTFQPLNPSGNATYSWITTTASCGSSTGIRIAVDNTTVGDFYVTHIDGAVTSGAITAGMTLGKAKSFTNANNQSCNPGPHVHMEFRNAANTEKSCYNDLTINTNYAAGTWLGNIGAPGVNDIQTACPEGTTAGTSPVDNDQDNDGVLNTHDDCIALAGPAATYGCPPRDVNNDALADIVVLTTNSANPSSKLGVHEMNTAAGYNWYNHYDSVMGPLDEPRQEALIGDTNGDRRPEIVIVNRYNTGSGKVEVHPLSGTTHYSSWVNHYVTPANYLNANQRLLMADMDKDRRADLVIVDAVSSATGKVELHTLTASSNFTSWIHQTSQVPFLTAGQKIFLGDVDQDRYPDIIVVSTTGTPSGKVEVDEYTRASSFATQRHYVTVADYPNSSQEILVGEVNFDTYPELIVVNKWSTGSGKVEIHPLSGITHYSTWLGHYTPTVNYFNNTNRLLISPQ